MANNKNLMLLNDEIAKTDLLNIQEYIYGFSDFINICETPITISVQGDWGSGKTSFVNQVRNINTNNYWIEINTWQLSVTSSEEMFPYIVLQTIADRIESATKGGTTPPNNQSNNKSNKNPIDIYKLFELGNILKFADLFTGKNVSEIINPALQNKKSIYDEIDGIITNFEKQINNKCKNDEKVVIFIDDLDRLQPRIALDLLEKLSNFFKCKNCVYILAIDEMVFKQGVLDKYYIDAYSIDEEAYKTFLSESKRNQFFEKIIQVPFNLPTSDYNFNGLIDNNTSAFNNTSSIDPSKIIADYDKCKDSINSISTNSKISLNPRFVKRLINLFALHKLILNRKNTSLNSLDDKVLISLLSIQIYNRLHFQDVISKLRSIEFSKPDVLDEEVDIIKGLNEYFNNASTDLKIDKDNYKIYGEIADKLKGTFTATSESSSQTAEMEDLDNAYHEIQYNDLINKHLMTQYAKEKKSIYIKYTNSKLLLTIKIEKDRISILYYYDKTSISTQNIIDSIEELLNKENGRIATPQTTTNDGRNYIKFFLSNKTSQLENILKIVDTVIKGSL